jgi:hypothetical protein
MAGGFGGEKLKAFWNGMFVGAILGMSFSVYYLDNQKRHQISRNLLDRSQGTKTAIRNFSEEIIGDIGRKQE